ncbi:CAAX protease [Campylobacter showae]|uniref:CAAX protease n=1 Tax=Campylobacter showae TaxID=204 RepID=UPI003C6F05DB
MFDIVQSQYEKIYDIFKQGYDGFMDHEFEARIKRAISVLHFKYLIGACKEANAVLPKTDLNNLNLFDLIISIYNKRRRTHQAKFFLLHCFESGLRSTLAVNFSNLYNQDADDWFFRTNKPELGRILNIVKRRCKNEDLQNLGTFGIFDKFYMIDLEELSDEYWYTIEHIFASTKEYKSQILPAYGRQHLITKIGQIRKARNEIYHNNPTKIKFAKDLEILLLRMGYNLQDAVGGCDFRGDIKLQYKYD